MNLSPKELQKLKSLKSLDVFVKQVLRAKPSKQQQQVIDALENGDRKISIRSGHSIGKSSLLSWILLWFVCTKKDAKVACTAPTAHQLFDILWQEVQKWVFNMPEIFKKEIDITKDRILVKNGNFAVARTARKDNPEALQGLHSTNMLFIIDEASGVDNKIYEVAEGSLTSPNAYAILTGNPTRSDGFFFDTHHKQRQYWTTFQFKSTESDFATPEWCKQMAEKYGVDSDIYRVRVLGEFPQAGQDVLIPYQLVADAMNMEVCNEDGAEVWGLDVARYGDDYTVLAKRKGYRVYEITEKSNLDTMQVASWLANEYMKQPRKPQQVFVDTIGIGAGVFDRLKQLGIPVAPANVALNSTDATAKNMRAEIYLKLKDALQMGLKLPQDDELLAELTSIRYKFDSVGKLQLEAKEDMKKRIGRSPDKADAVALTFFMPVADKDYNKWDIEIPEMAAGY